MRSNAKVLHVRPVTPLSIPVVSMRNMMGDFPSLENQRRVRSRLASPQRGGRVRDGAADTVRRGAARAPQRRGQSPRKSTRQVRTSKSKSKKEKKKTQGSGGGDGKSKSRGRRRRARRKRKKKKTRKGDLTQSMISSKPLHPRVVPVSIAERRVEEVQVEEARRVEVRQVEVVQQVVDEAPAVVEVPSTVLRATPPMTPPATPPAAEEDKTHAPQGISYVSVWGRRQGAESSPVRPKSATARRPRSAAASRTPPSKPRNKTRNKPKTRPSTAKPRSSRPRPRRKRPSTASPSRRLAKPAENHIEGVRMPGLRPTLRPLRSPQRFRVWAREPEQRCQSAMTMREMSPLSDDYEVPSPVTPTEDGGAFLPNGARHQARPRQRPQSARTPIRMHTVNLLEPTLPSPEAVAAELAHKKRASEREEQNQEYLAFHARQARVPSSFPAGFVMQSPVARKRPLRLTPTSSSYVASRIVSPFAARSRDKGLHSLTGYLHSELSTACKHSDIDRVLELLDGGMTPEQLNETDRNGSTALFHAAWHSYNDIAGALLDAGADVNVRNLRGNTCTDMAIERGNTETVKRCILYGADTTAADVSRVDARLRTSGRGVEPAIVALFEAQENEPQHAHDAFVACKQGNYDRLLSSLELMQQIDGPEAVNFQDRDGATLLHYAAFHGHQRIAMLLCDSGAKTTLRDNDGATPLDVAMNRNHYAVARILTRRFVPLDAGVELESDVADLVRREKLAVRAQRIRQGVRRGDLRLVRELLADDAASGMSDAINVPSQRQTTALHMAIMRQDAAMCELLLGNGADPERRNLRHKNAIRLAFDYEDNAEVISLLVNADAKLALPDALQALASSKAPDSCLYGIQLWLKRRDIEVAHVDDLISALVELRVALPVERAKAFVEACLEHGQPANPESLTAADILAHVHRLRFSRRVQHLPMHVEQVTDMLSARKDVPSPKTAAAAKTATPTATTRTVKVEVDVSPGPTPTRPTRPTLERQPSLLNQPVVRNPQPRLTSNPLSSFSKHKSSLTFEQQIKLVWILEDLELNLDHGGVMTVDEAARVNPYLHTKLANRTRQRNHMFITMQDWANSWEQFAHDGGPQAVDRFITKYQRRLTKAAIRSTQATLKPFRT